MNRFSLKLVLTICAIFGMWMVSAVGQAQAGLIGPFDGTGTNHDADWFNTNLFYINSQAGISVHDSSLTMYELDKDEFNEPPVSTKDLEGYLHVEITNTTKPGTANISWTLPSDFEAWYVAVKDGETSNTGLKWVWYQVHSSQRYGGSGSVSTVTNGNGAISNIALYGTRGTSVPDASIMLLLGSSLLGLAIFDRKRKKS